MKFYYLPLYSFYGYIFRSFLKFSLRLKFVCICKFQNQMNKGSISASQNMNNSLAVNSRVENVPLISSRQEDYVIQNLPPLPIKNKYSKTNNNSVDQDPKNVSQSLANQRQVDLQTNELQFKKNMLQKYEGQAMDIMIQKDLLRFIQFYGISKNIKVNKNILRQKAKTQLKLAQTITLMQNEIKGFESEMNDMEQYERYLNQQQDILTMHDKIQFDVNEEAQILLKNLQNQIDFLQAQYSKDVREMDKQLKDLKGIKLELRVQNNYKANLIKKLHQEKFELHIRKQNRSNTKDKTVKTLKKVQSANKIIIQQEGFHQQYVGLQQVSNTYNKMVDDTRYFESQFSKIIFQADKQNNIIFACQYKNKKGITHQPNFAIKPHEQAIIEVKDITSLRFFIKHKIVGIQIQFKATYEKGKKVSQRKIGNCERNIDSVMVNLAAKKLVKLSSYWKQNNLVGMGVYTARQQLAKKYSQKKFQQQQVSSRKPVNEYYVN